MQFKDNVGRPVTVNKCKGPNRYSRAPGIESHTMPCVVIGITSTGTNTPRTQTIHLSLQDWDKLKESAEAILSA